MWVYCCVMMLIVGVCLCGGVFDVVCVGCVFGVYEGFVEWVCVL